MKKTMTTLAVLVAVFALAPVAWACEPGQNCWTWNDASQSLKQGAWTNDSNLSATQKATQALSGGVNCGSTDITAAQDGLTNYQNQTNLPNFSNQQRGSQLLNAASSGKAKNKGEFGVSETLKQKSGTETNLGETSLGTNASDLQKASGQGNTTGHATVSTSANMSQLNGYDVSASTPDGSWSAQQNGARLQEMTIDASAQKGGSFTFDVKQTSDGSTNLSATGDKMSGAMSQQNSTAAAGRNTSISADQTRVDMYNQTQTKPGFSGSQSGGILSNSSVTIKPSNH